MRTSLLYPERFLRRVTHHSLTAAPRPFSVFSALNPFPNLTSNLEPLTEHPTRTRVLSERSESKDLSCHLSSAFSHSCALFSRNPFVCHSYAFLRGGWGVFSASIAAKSHAINARLRPTLEFQASHLPLRRRFDPAQGFFPCSFRSPTSIVEPPTSVVTSRCFVSGRPGQRTLSFSLPRDTDPGSRVTKRGFLTPVDATLASCLTSVDSKELTESLTPLDATLAKNQGEGYLFPSLWASIKLTLQARFSSLALCLLLIPDLSGEPV